MSRNLTGPMLTHIAQDYTSLCCCWLHTLTSALQIGFTNHTRPLVIDGVTYQPTNGIDPTTISSTIGTSVDNMEITSVIDTSLITEENLLTGYYDYARVMVFLTNWQDPTTYGKIILQLGYIGEVRFENGQFVAEARSLIQIGSQDIIDLTSPTCRVKRLGFDGCGVNLGGSTASTDTGGSHSITQSFAVVHGTSITGSRKQFTISGASAYDNFFQYGSASFTAGSNNFPLSIEIKTYVQSTGLVTLQENMPHDILGGDNVTLIAGCDRTRLMCYNKYNNVVNFRGEPDVPGLDVVLASPLG